MIREILIHYLKMTNKRRYDVAIENGFKSSLTNIAIREMLDIYPPFIEELNKHPYYAKSFINIFKYTDNYILFRCYNDSFAWVYMVIYIKDNDIHLYIPQYNEVNEEREQYPIVDLPDELIEEFNPELIEVEINELLR